MGPCLNWKSRSEAEGEEEGRSEGRKEDVAQSPEVLARRVLLLLECINRCVLFISLPSISSVYTFHLSSFFFSFWGDCYFLGFFFTSHIIMAAADVRDMLDLPAEGQPRPHKKQKVAEKRPGSFLTFPPKRIILMYPRGYNSRTIRASR